MGGDLPEGGIDGDAPGSRRVDVLDYDRFKSDTSIELVELRQRTSSGEERRAVDKVIEYQRDLPSGTANRAKVLKNVTFFTDRFRVLVKDCAQDSSVSKRVVAQYQTRPAASGPGVLMIDRKDTETDCPKRGDPPLPPVAAEGSSEDVAEDVDEPPPPKLYPAPGRDDDRNGKDDFWERFRDEHRELDDLDEIPIPQPSRDPVPSGKQILVGALVAVVLVAVVAACIAFCAQIAAFLASLSASLALASTGAVSLSTVLGGLAGLIGLQKLWNLWGDPHS